jgi:hypothetical protein
MDIKESILITKSTKKENRVIVVKLDHSKTTLTAYHTLTTVGMYNDDSYVELYEADDFELASLIAMMKLIGKEKAMEALNKAFSD